MLANFPLCIAGEFMGTWLDLKMLVNLDSAFCNHEFRQYFIDILASPYCTLTAKVNVFNGASVNWLVTRQLKVSNLEILQNTEQASIIAYLQHFGKHVHKVECENASAIATLAEYTHHLTSLTCRNILVPRVSDLLSSNFHIQELRLERVQGLQTVQWLSIELVHLRMLSLQRSTCTDNCLNTLVCGSKQLTRLNLNKCKGITEAGLIKVCQSCPLLQVIELQGLSLSDQMLFELVTLCPKITDLNISNNPEVTDAGIQNISQRLQSLQWLSVATCAKLTDCSLVHITENCARTLHALYIINFRSVRISVLKTLLKRCQKLIKLVTSLNLAPQSRIIVPFLCRLKLLVLYSVTTDEVLTEIAQHCKRLRNLTITYNQKVWVDTENIDTGTHSSDLLYGASLRNSTNITPYSEKGLLAVVQNLPQLTLLELMEKNSSMFRVAFTQWQEQHPRLKVISRPFGSL